MDRALTQEEANALLAMEKRCSVTDALVFPSPGQKLIIPVEAKDGREQFLLDVARGRISLKKCTYQERARATIVLVRVDIEGPDHTNPDGQTIACPHIHLYCEGYGDKWAHPLPSSFQNPDNLLKTLLDFFDYCHVTEVPMIQGSFL